MNNKASNKDQTFITKLIFPLMGLSDKDIEYAQSHTSFKKLPLSTVNNSVGLNSKDICFLSDSSTITIKTYDEELVNGLLSIQFEEPLDDEDYKLFKYLFNCYRLYTGGKDDHLINNALINENINELILQKGLISYLISDNDYKNNYIDNLIKCLQRWSEKTYEGHNVCYGFIINLNPGEKKYFKDKSESYGDFVDFIGEEYSAVFTDGITSVVEIDKNCNFIEYKSILHSDSPLPDNLHNVYLPIRFAQIIYENVDKNNVGLFLLTNGDIILARNKMISFVKRGGRWLNFSQRSFYNIVSDYVGKDENLKTIIQSIYCSCLDISFAHSGGLIAIVDANNDNWKKDVSKEIKPIVTKIDTLGDADFNNIQETLDDIYKKECERINKNKEGRETIIEGLLKDLKKRLTKKRYLLQILKDNTYFPRIDRKLRADLSGLDGAMILDLKGNIVACGAIIANEAGSSGGGRGSAARTLSKYGGFAIKISTDGYIEAFYDGARIYAIK